MTLTKPLQLGPYHIDPPVVLAPMAGVTNPAFRRLCREHGAGLYVCEMVTARALVERNAKTLRMITFDAEERPRSLQLYGVDPDTVGRAVAMVVNERLADHVDLNVGCPVPKVTRKGGGAALPYRRRVFERVLRAAVRAAAGALPVTVKMRLGIDEERLTYLDAGRIAQDAGVAAVALHARTAEQYYSGRARWDRIATLVQALDVPVLGNGDIWEADDAVRMVAETGCAGVVVGRGCLGRPWLFADLAAAFAGRPERRLPALGEVAAALLRHGQLAAGHLGETGGMTDLRKHMAWYLKGFAVGPALRRRLAMVSTLGELREALAELDAEQPFPAAALGVPRGRVAPARRVALPAGWLADPDAEEVPWAADTDGGSGG
jgi:nifR3 family TIM-barrel protein